MTKKSLNTQERSMEAPTFHGNASKGDVSNSTVVTSSETTSMIQSVDGNDQALSNTRKSIVFSSNQIEPIASKISIASSSSNITITTDDKTTVSSSVTSTSFSASFTNGESDARNTDDISKNKGGIFNYVANLPLSPSSSMTSPPGNSNVSNSSSQLLLRHPDAIPQLIALLSHPTRDVHEQAMWILGSIAAGDGASSPVPNPSNSSLTHFANTNNMPLPSQIPSFTNPPSSSSNSPTSVAQAREQVLQAGAMNAILACLEANPHVLRLQRIGSWALSNLVNVQYQQPSAKNQNKNTTNGSAGSIMSSSSNQSTDINIKTLLPTLKRLLYTADAEVLSHTCWALSHLCDGPSSYISRVVSPAGGLVPRLVELLLHPSWRVTKPALRTIGNVVCAECVDDTSHTGDLHSSSFPSHGNSGPGGVMIPVDYTETILECGAVPRLKQLITHGNREIQKEACWTLSNIAAGAVDQIQAVIDSGAIAPLVKLASDPNADQEVRSEACWVVLNATSCGSDAQIETLVKEGCISVLGVLLGEQSMVMMALEGLERVLQVEEGKELQRKKNNLQCRPCSSIEAEATSVVSASLIEALEKHKNNAVSKRAVKIWNDHFVSCALCKQSFSRHRANEADFCNECKCHVCKDCDCTIYHLSYQEEFWAATEESAQAKSMAKKSKKNKKKQKKKKQKKLNANSVQYDSSHTSSKEKKSDTAESSSNARINIEDDVGVRSRSSTVTSYSAGSGSGLDHNFSGQNKPPINELAVLDEKQQLSKQTLKIQTQQTSTMQTLDKTQGNHDGKSHSSDHKELLNKSRKNINEDNKTFALYQSDDDDDYFSSPISKPLNVQDENAEMKKDKDCSDIDLVHYLQQTGSIIALSRLLDQLDGDFSIANIKDKGVHLVSYDEVDREVNMKQHLIGTNGTAICRTDN